MPHVGRASFLAALGGVLLGGGYLPLTRLFHSAGRSAHTAAERAWVTSPACVADACVHHEWDVECSHSDDQRRKEVRTHRACCPTVSLAQSKE